MGATEPSPKDVMKIPGGRRLSLVPEGLRVETRGGGGTWVCARFVPYDEIRAVYSYQSQDWGYLVIALLYWLAAVFLIVLPASILQLDGNLSLGAVLLATVVVGGLAAYRIFTVPHNLLRIDAYSGSLILPNKAPVFFRRLSAHLPKPEATAPDVPTAAFYPDPASSSGSPGAFS